MLLLAWIYVCSWWLGWAAAVVVVWCRSLLLIMMMIMLTCWWWKRKRQENHHHQQLDSQHRHYYKLNSISPQKWTLFCFREKQSIKTTPRVKSYIYFHHTHTNEITWEHTNKTRVSVSSSFSLQNYSLLFIPTSHVLIIITQRDLNNKAANQLLISSSHTHTHLSNPSIHHHHLEQTFFKQQTLSNHQAVLLLLLLFLFCLLACERRYDVKMCDVMMKLTIHTYLKNCLLENLSQVHNIFFVLVCLEQDEGEAEERIKKKNRPSNHNYHHYHHHQLDLLPHIRECIRVSC